jgi:hypothetical protein
MDTMKWFLLLATLVGGLAIFGSASTANAYPYRVRYAYGPYGYRAVYRPRYAYPPPYVAPGVVVAGPRVGIGVGVAPVYTYPAPVYGPGYVYPGYYGW